MCSHPILCTEQCIDQPVANLLVVSGTGKMNISYLPVPPPLRISSRKTASAVLSRVSLIILHAQAESHACYTCNRASPKFIGSRYCLPRVRRHRVSTGRLKGAPVTGATFEGHHGGSINVQISCPNCSKENLNASKPSF